MDVMGRVHLADGLEVKVGSDDDFLGQHQVNPEPRGELSSLVEGDGSDYTINYLVS